ncbi:MAG: enoyl-CoA hydratase/isomerase family protein [Acidimicrobiales bacterium]
MIIERSTHGDVVVLTWNDGENRYRGDSVAAWHAALDDVEATEGPVALVVTGTGKFFSNGLDLDWMNANRDETQEMLGGVHRLLGRIMLLDCYSVAAVNGHAFAGGAMLTCGFDERVMRDDRGYWCLPEVDLGLPLTPAMYAAVAAHLPPPTLHESIITGRRYDAAEALAAGIVEHTAPEADVLGLAIERAQAMASKNRSVIAVHKRQMYGAAADLCLASV